MLFIDFEHFKKATDDTVPQIDEAATSQPSAILEEEEEKEVYDKLRIFSSLSQFQVKLFKGEPKLVILR